MQIVVWNRLECKIFAPVKVQTYGALHRQSASRDAGGLDAGLNTYRIVTPVFTPCAYHHGGVLGLSETAVVTPQRPV